MRRGPTAETGEAGGGSVSATAGRDRRSRASGSEDDARRRGLTEEEAQQTPRIDNKVECPKAAMKLSTLSTYIAILLLILITVCCEAKKHKKAEKQVQSRETSLFNFFRILVMRLVYGIATSLGFGESISNLWGGAFVPPGVNDDYDDYGFDDDF